MSFFDHFTGSSLDTAKWTAITSGGGAVSVTGGYVECNKAANTDGAAIYLNQQIDKTKNQLFSWAINQTNAANFGGPTIIEKSTAPVCENNVAFDPRVRMKMTFSTQSTVLGLAINYYNSSHVLQWWNPTSNVWTTTGTNAAITYEVGNYWTGFLETDATLGWRMGIIANGITGATWSFDQQAGNVRLVTLTDWVAWSSLEATTSLWLVFGMNVTISVAPVWRMEWFRHADGPRARVMVSQKAAASGNYACRVWRHYGDYCYVPYDRSTDAIAADARIPFVLESSSGTLACAYMVGGTGIKLSTSTDPTMEGTWTAALTIANPGTTKRNTIADAMMIEDLAEPDANQRFKWFLSCLNAGPPYEARIYYAYSATLTGAPTWYDNGSGIDDSFVLGLGSAGQPDEGGVDCPRIIPTAGGFTMLYSGLKNGSALLEAQPCFATSPNMTNGGTWTRGSLPLFAHGSVTTEITASLDGKSATVTSTTGFVADAAFVIGQDGTTSDNHSAGRIRTIPDSTHLEFYGTLRDFNTTKPARIRQWDSSPRIDFLAIEFNSSLQKWVVLATVYQWFNLDSPTIVAHYETTALLTADALTGATWTMDYTISPPIPTSYFGGQRSNENPAFITRPFPAGGPSPHFVRRLTGGLHALQGGL